MKKRQVAIDNFNQVRDDVQMLLRCGYECSGNWNLAQTCRHLNCWMSYAMEGYPALPFIIRPMMWTMKLLMGKRMLQKILSEGQFKDKQPTSPATVFTSDRSEDQAAAMEFLTTLERFDNFTDKPHTSPLFGEMTLDQCRQLQLIHCRHHLAFLSPTPV